ncbi:unnamed protein product [Polarella glacialis]|uniref:Subtilisin n=1 Tax=Polarella glacialis TaxID=89957 RepID=A0A813IWT1_POLGL|nr:unnamed protein product [Polarella glacialis]
MASAPSSRRLSWAAAFAASLLGLCLAAAAGDLAAPPLEQPVDACGPDAESCGTFDVSSALQLRRGPAELSDGAELSEGAEPSENISRRILYDFVQQYDDIGETRLTGTPSDKATSAWIRERLEEAGLSVELQPYAIPGGPLWVPSGEGSEYSDYGCHLKLDHKRVPCYVVQSPPAKPVALTNVSMARVLVVDKMSGYELESAQDLLSQHVDAQGNLPYDVAFVVQKYDEPVPFTWKQKGMVPSVIPVVTVPAKFRHLMCNGSIVTSLTLSGRWHTNATSHNVIATLPSFAPAACNATLAAPLPFYLGTPFNCFEASDCAPHRAAGVAVLMAVARDLASNPVQCQKDGSAEHRCMMPVFGFSSGHDMGDPGITDGILPYLEKLASRLEVSLSEVVYVSLGASLGNRALKNGTQSSVLPLLAQSFPNGHNISTAMSAFQGTVCSDSVSGLSTGCSQPAAVIGAARSPLKAGMMVLNLVSYFDKTFHYPWQQGIQRLDFYQLQRIARITSKALRAAICSGVR